MSLGPVGIDFGTTKTALAYYDDNGKRQIISFPTTVYFPFEGNRQWEGASVGNLDSANSPLYIWKNFKPYLGKNDQNEWMGEELYSRCHAGILEDGVEPPSTVQLAAFVLRHLKIQYCKAREAEENAEAQDNKERKKGKIKKENWNIGPATLTVPALSTFQQRQKLIFAAYLAGFQDICVIEEPIAAYLMHYFKEHSPLREKEKSLTLVIDFGGGTCDLALIENAYPSLPHVLGTSTVLKGQDEYGGNDIDGAILGRWKEKDPEFCSMIPASIPPPMSRDLMNAAKHSKEDANPTKTENKEILSNPLVSQIEVPPRKTDYILIDNNPIAPPNLTPEDLEAVMVDIRPKLYAGIQYLLGEMRIETNQIKRVILAGGTCYLRQLIQYVLDLFDLPDLQKEILFEEPEFAIAYGALEYQSRLSRHLPLIRNKLAMSIYLQVDYDPNDISESKKTTPMIPYNGKGLVVLAQRGSPLGSSPKLKVIPVKPNIYGRHTWPIYQTRPTSSGKDYENIDDQMPTIETVEFRGNWPSISIITRMDQMGNLHISAKKTGRIVHFHNQLDSHKEWDWRNRKHLNCLRNDYFQNWLDAELK